MELADQVKEQNQDITVLRKQLNNLRDLLRQCESDKLQLQTSYDKALQTLADSEAKRETAEKELKVAHDQMASMWKELEMLHKRLNGSNISTNTSQLNGSNITTTNTSQQISSNNENSKSVLINNEGSIELCCTLCKEKIRYTSSPPLIHNNQEYNTTMPSLNNTTPTTKNTAPSYKSTPPTTKKSSKLWPFSQKPRLNQLDEHSKVCSTKVPPKPVKQLSSSPSHTRINRHSQPSSQTNSPKLVRKQKQNVNIEDRNTLTVNVTRTPTNESDLAPFKVVTRTTIQQFQKDSYEVYRGAGDFQWLHDVLIETCPERVIPPLRATISLDATVSEYQRFLHRLTCHKVLRVEQYFITFLTGSVEELRVLRAKFRPHLLSDDGYMYRPAQGRDTTSGALVATKDYLQHLEKSINSLVQKLYPSHNEEEGSMADWFWAIANGEPSNTYLKIASTDLARTCEAIESNRGGVSDGDDTLCIENLQSIADYIHSAQELLLRVEQAVDKFLFWDEEVTICEAVTSSPITSDIGLSNSQIDEVYDDSGVSSISGSSANSLGDKASSPVLDRHRIGEDSISEKWAQASSNCADAKEYLEMMCRDLSEELALFDFRKEQEMKQVFLDLSSSQLEKNEKLQGKWYAMKCILDFPIRAEHRAINFVSNKADDNGQTNNSNR